MILTFIGVLLLAGGSYAYKYSSITVNATVTDPITISQTAFSIPSPVYPNEQIPLTIKITNSGTTEVILTFNANITRGPGGNGTNQADFSYIFPQPYVALPGTSTMTAYLVVSNGAPPGSYTISITPERAQS